MARKGFISVLVVFLLAGLSQAQQAPRERVSINSDWRFTRDDPAGTGEKLSYTTNRAWMLPTGDDLLKDQSQKHMRPTGNFGSDVSYTTAEFNDGQWRQLNLPHDFAVEGPFSPSLVGETGKLPYFGVAWYRKHLEIPAADQGKQIYLDIDGAMAYPNIWLNGQYVGGWGYGYSSFRVDLTPYVKYGAQNVLAIRLDNPNTSSRWYPGGGIYRNVWLVKSSPVHVGQYGTYITTPDATAASASVDIKTTVENKSAAAANVSVRTQVFAIDINDQKTGPAVASTEPVTLQIGAGKNALAAAKATVANPKLWSIKSPNRYIAITTVEQNGKAVDVYETPFGVRTIKFDVLKGFVLNDEAMKFQGVCNHHDLGALGSAINTRALQRQLEILREMGTNAIRTSHNPPAPELLDLCDKMGFVVMDETFDCWVQQKRANDYHLLFNDWSEKDVRTLIRRDRNHPSVVIWSIGNEIAEQRVTGHPVAIRLAGLVREEDPTRPVTAGCNNFEASTNGFQNIVDIFGFNYLRGPVAEQPNMYVNFHKASPEKFVYSTESSSAISTRGFYVFPVTEPKAGGYSRMDQQMSSYDLYAPNWATTPDAEWEAQDRSGVAAGEFVWTGFDYLGEPTVNITGGGRGRGAASGPATASAAPQDTRRSSYFGIIDIAGFPKDRYYLYQSRWRADLPMAHILPHWNWAERAGEVTPVHVYTSGDEGELFLNGKSLGKKKKGQYQYRLRWDDVVYEPGELKVVTWKAGKEWAQAVTKTTGAASNLLLQPDRNKITADGSDLSFVTVSVADKDSQMVPRSMNMLQFEISGPGEIVAVDNGDPTSMESFQTKQMKAFNGLCLVIVRSKLGQAGQITLRAKSDGLQNAEVLITTSR